MAVTLSLLFEAFIEPHLGNLAPTLYNEQSRVPSIDRMGELVRASESIPNSYILRYIYTYAHSPWSYNCSVEEMTMCRFSVSKNGGVTNMSIA